MKKQLPDVTRLRQKDMTPINEQDVLEHFKKRMVSHKDAFQSLWRKGEDNKRFYGGGEEQWHISDRKRREENEKPTLSMNNTALAINGLAGRENTQRLQTTFVGRNSKDPRDSGWAGALREYDRRELEQSFAAETESDAYKDLLITGAGWLDWRQDFMVDWRGRSMVDRPEPWEMIWDGDSRQRNFMDANWNARGYMATKDEVLTRFPKKRNELSKAAAVSNARIGDANVDFPWELRMNNKFLDNETDRVFLVNYQWREREPYYLVKPPGQPATTFTREEWKALGQQTDGIEYVGPEDGAFRWVWREAWMVGDVILRQRKLPYGMSTRLGLSGVPVTTRSNFKMMGVVDWMKDPQRFSNIVYSMAVSHLSRARKGGMMFEAGMFENEAEVENQLSKQFPILRVKRNKLSDGRKRWQELDHNEFPHGLVDWMQIAEQATFGPTGLNKSTSFGMVDDPRRVSGSALGQLQNAGNVVMSHYPNALRIYRKQSGTLRMKMYAEHADPEHFAAVVGPGHAQFIPPQEEWVNAFNQDVIVDEVPTEQSERTQFWEWMTRTDLASSLMQQLPSMTKVLIENMPIISQVSRQELLDEQTMNIAQQLIAQLQQMPPEESQQMLEQALQAIAPQDPQQQTPPQ